MQALWLRCTLTSAALPKGDKKPKGDRREEERGDRREDERGDRRRGEERGEMRREEREEDFGSKSFHTKSPEFTFGAPYPGESQEASGRKKIG